MATLEVVVVQIVLPTREPNFIGWVTLLDHLTLMDDQ
jgi:hypothetical protein